MRNVWVGKRQASRTTALIRAEIRTGDDKFIGPCIVIDISKSGARARLEGEYTVPEMFALYIPARKETRVCKLRWHRDGEVGIEFISAEQITTFQSVVALELRVKALEQALASANVPLPSGEDLELARAVATPSKPGQDDGEALARRIDGLENDVTRTSERLQDEIAAGARQNLAMRMGRLEATQADIHAMLQSLIPMLQRRAS